jgi:hypothetical protein
VVQAFAGQVLPTVLLAIMELASVIVPVQEAKAAPNVPA